MTPQEFIRKWLAENVNPDVFHTTGVFDPNTPAITTRQLLLFAKDAGFSEAEIQAAQPNLQMEVSQAIMRVVEQHKEKKKG